jgi:hypothetical protein
MHTDIATRAFVVALKSSGGKTTPEVAEATGLPLRTVNHIYARAIQRGFDLNHRPIIIKDKYLRDTPRSGRPSRQSTEAVQNTVSLVRINWYRREKTYTDITGNLSLRGFKVSATTV